MAKRKVREVIETAELDKNEVSENEVINNIIEDTNSSNESNSNTIESSNVDNNTEEETQINSDNINKSNIVENENTTFDVNRCIELLKLINERTVSPSLLNDCKLVLQNLELGNTISFTELKKIFSKLNTHTVHPAYSLQFIEFYKTL